jgi:hypothetical protein
MGPGFLRKNIDQANEGNSTARAADEVGSSLREKKSESTERLHERAGNIAAETKAQAPSKSKKSGAAAGSRVVDD